MNIYHPIFSFSYPNLVASTINFRDLKPFSVLLLTGKLDINFDFVTSSNVNNRATQINGRKDLFLSYSFYTQLTRFITWKIIFCPNCLFKSLVTNSSNTKEEDEETVRVKKVIFKVLNMAF